MCKEAKPSERDADDDGFGFRFNFILIQSEYYIGCMHCIGIVVARMTCKRLRRREIY